jgi:hypothetical protein
LESTVAAWAGTTGTVVLAGAAEVAAPSLVAVAGGGAAEVEPVTVVTSGAVSVREMDVSCSEEAEELEELPDDTALETELVMVVEVERAEEMVAETDEPKLEALLREARLELRAAAEEELAAATEDVLALLALTMLDDNDVATGSGVVGDWLGWHEIR